MKNNNLVLVIAGLLILVGLTKFDLSKLNVLPNRPVAVDVLELPKPTDEAILKEASDVLQVVQKQVSKTDARRLRDLTLDIRKLVELDGEDEVIRNTEEIRQANSLAGVMLRMDIKGKYADLAKECKEVIVAAIGDDQIVLTPTLRSKALDGFDALAWALNEGSK